MRSSCLVVASLVAVVGAHGNHGSTLNFVTKTIEDKLPKPISDLTATVIGQDVYLAGGCDNPEGNVFVPGSSAGFKCPSVSSSLYRFDGEKETVEELSPLPRQRYRHAAVGINGKLWLVGGRDSDGNVISEIDVYDVAGGSWSTVLANTFPTSDLAAFAHGNLAYFVGGYNQLFEAQSIVWRLDTSMVSDGTIPVGAVTQMPSLRTERGDVAGAYSNTKGYVSGGFSHEDDFCTPLRTVEVYDFATDTWSSLPDLGFARSDKGLAILDDHLYAIGGERQIANKCTVASRSSAGLGDLTVAVDVVERYDEDTKSWILQKNLPVHRFRFAVAVLPEANEIITFGGQQTYNADCQCLRGTTDIVVYQDLSGNANKGSGASSYSLWTGILILIGLPVFAL